VTPAIAVMLIVAAGIAIAEPEQLLRITVIAVELLVVTAVAVLVALEAVAATAAVVLTVTAVIVVIGKTCRCQGSMLWHP
jgi:hypothetical protein